MSEFKRFEPDEFDGVYYNTKQLSNGQTAAIFFCRHWMSTISYHIGFAVADKKKQINAWMHNAKGNNITLKSTGTCGLEAFLWAKEQILEFEKWLLERHGQRVRIVVGWEDQRRRRVYIYALSKMGYRYDHAAKCLYKDIG